MQEKYSILDRESDLQELWKNNNINSFDENSDKPIYSIDTPPPTVSGKIHIWHIFSYTQAEVVARYKKMVWNILFYPFWFDDNWLPTEKLVEKEIWKKGSEMSREEFNDTCLKITEIYREKFKKLWVSMWFSVDWNLSYSSISPDVQKTSQLSFLKLINKWAIYNKEAPSLWCPECQTAIAQAEVDKKELDSVFYDIEFNLEDWTPITISTTRPELMPACVAVFVNSKDGRYTNLIWKNIITALWNKVKILWDDKVDIDKWSWVVMCCSYWDETDMYWIKKYGLDEKIILDKGWKIIDTWDEDIDWIYYKKARRIIIEKLSNSEKIINSKNIKHDVWTHERCSTPIEILTVKQWFIKTIDIKDELIKAWDKINWNPSHMKKRYTEWVENLKWDWCISRQRHFWIPLPVWYSKKTWEIILPDENQLPINPLKDYPATLPEWHTIQDIYPELDVLDTWATSSLTPLINSKFFEDENLNDKIVPMSLRPQAHDIIRTWTLYTIIMSYYHTWDIPFENLMISGHVLAPKWEKISKSKNNAWLSPEDLIKKYWADPIRYWACGWSLWKDIVFDEKEIDKWRKLVTKLWNASRYAILNLWDFNPNENLDKSNLENIDKWIIEKSILVWEKMKKSFDSFNVWHAVIEFEKFFWNDFCDNYLEIMKWKIVNSENFENWEQLKISSQYALYESLFNILKLIAPVLPHISEEIYQNYFKKYKEKVSIHEQEYPELNSEQDLLNIDKNVNKLFECITLIRKYKTENSIKYSQDSSELIVYWNSEDIEQLSDFSNELKSISRSKQVIFIDSDKLDVKINL